MKQVWQSDDGRCTSWDHLVVQKYEVQQKASDALCAFIAEQVEYGMDDSDIRNVVKVLVGFPEQVMTMLKDCK